MSLPGKTGETGPLSEMQMFFSLNSPGNTKNIPGLHGFTQISLKYCKNIC